MRYINSLPLLLLLRFVNLKNKKMVKAFLALFFLKTERKLVSKNKKKQDSAFQFIQRPLAESLLHIT